MNNLTTITIFTLVLLHLVHGGPAQKRNKREIYPEIEPEKVEDIQPQVCVVGDLVYEADEAVPAEQPCLKCKCKPPGVHCEATRCEKKPGCRAIHKPNTCCPDYQCECEYEGRTYANGERLEQKPGTECRVCYCRGGEVQCAEVSCYIRNDCVGRNVPGKCCPKYDHCPPKEPIVDRLVYATEATNATKEPFSENEINETSSLMVDKAVQTDDEIQKITIQEIIPDIKEIPITNSPKREISDAIHGQLLVEESISTEGKENAAAHTAHSETNKLQTESNEVDLPDAESDSSEVAEIYQEPPPVLRIGDKLLFLKEGELIPEKDASTPATIITIIGAEGLQRGFEDSVENHDVIKAELDNKTVQEEEDLQAVAESSHVLSLLNQPSSSEPNEDTTTDNATTSEAATTIDSTTEFISSSSTGTATAADDDDDLAVSNCTLYTVSVDLSSLEANESKEWSEPEYNFTESEYNETYSTAISTSTVPAKLTTEKEELGIHEINPEYPPIPDVMSPQIADELADNIEPDHAMHSNSTVESKILSEVVEVRSNKTSDNVTSTNNEWLKQTVLNLDAALPDSILKTVAASDLEDVTEIIQSTTVGETKLQSKSSTSTSEKPEKFGVAIENNQFTLNHIKALSQEDEVPAAALKSVETVESTEESDEAVTPASSSDANAAAFNVDASVEGMASQELPMSDLVEIIPEAENRSVEVVEVPEATTDNVTSPVDVELVDIDVLSGHASDKNATHADEEQANKISKLGKRENAEDDKIFEELNREIELDAGTLVENKTKEEEEKEAQAIFKELLDETQSNTTPKPINLRGDDRESAVLKRVSDALAKFQLRDSKQSLNTNILGILRDFFSAQYRTYK